MPGPYTSDFQDVFGLQPFGALLDLELHLRTLLQGFVTVCLDGGKMNEHVVAARPLDESKALGGIKPFHCAFFFHYTFSQLRKVFSQIAPIWSSAKKRRPANWRRSSESGGGWACRRRAAWCWESATTARFSGPAALPKTFCSPPICSSRACISAVKRTAPGTWAGRPWGRA